MAKILIANGEKLNIKSVGGIRTAEGEVALKKEWKDYRDRYWDDDFSKFSDYLRDGTCIDYDDFYKRVNHSEIGIHLQINNFKAKAKVEVHAKAYNKVDLEQDIDLINKKGEPNKLIITKRSLLEAKINWDLVDIINKKIRIGVGKNACGNPVIFILLANEDCITNESNMPIRFPPQNQA